jgi:hypothetical protein
MDDSRFDALARSLVAPGSRRRLLAGLAAGALGVIGVGPAGARTCSRNGLVCREHASCCSGYCGPKDAIGRRRCAAPPCTPGGGPCNLFNPGACCSQVCVNGAPTPTCQ